MSEQKTVFISYRREKSRHLARSIYQDLRSNGWDVFFDVNTIDSGDFDRIILNQIAARAHFILLISPDSLARCVNEGDWVLQEIAEAVRLDRNIVPILEEGASLEKELSYLPADLQAVLSKKNGVALYHDYFEEAMNRLRTRFLKAPAYIAISTPSIPEQAEVKQRMELIVASSHSTYTAVTDLISNQFDWIDIPSGKVTMMSEYSFNVSAFRMTKYPVTNSQFAKFIDIGGYHERKLWTDAGWQQRQKENWNQPRFWATPKWNSAQQPVVGISWYEGLAFCKWLSEEINRKITLPTEQQWQYAAQGDDSRLYPWGNDWDCERCNNSVNPCESNETTHVTQYEGKGNSPFDIVDLSGNISEWCFNATTTDKEKLESTDLCNLRGGSWSYINKLYFRCDWSVNGNASDRTNQIGFRIILS